LVKALKSVDFPTFGKPTIPTDRLIKMNKEATATIMNFVPSFVVDPEYTFAPQLCCVQMYIQQKLLEPSNADTPLHTIKS
jgi:hypothetical protein